MSDSMAIVSVINYSLILQQADATIQISSRANLDGRVDDGAAQSCVIKVRSVAKK